MLNFLKQTRKFINSAEPVCIVLGNESCDLDSAVCAVTLAYHYQQQRGQTNSLSNRKTRNFLPVLNIPRRDYTLKTEVNYLFDQQSISNEYLTFRDDLQQEFLARSEFILVDHHVSPFAARCLEVFDHRAFDEKAQLANDCKVHLELVGSCATLIAELILEDISTTVAPDVLAMYEILFTMLRSTIVLDTVNFSESANRYTPKDVEISKKLEHLLTNSNSDKTLSERNQIFDELVAARADISRLTAIQLLRKDLKILKNTVHNLSIAIPGFPMLVQKFIERPNAESAVKEFSEETNSAIVILMGMLITNGNVERDLGFINLSSGELCATIQQTLLTNTEPSLCLQQHEKCDFLNGSFYKLCNVKVTRKHILPIVKQLLDKYQM
ncbi:exopolyphosphatase PRUNE1 [Ceratitis capitata]|uniref:exopolyphosphatase PRUNE1 n=1 Tax=Ceratitis capitata TaxID=7213 RepID=UPI00032A3CE5|nr:exopolyphosphatase PRUNE1 [Ceratitis capitata]